MGLGASKCPCYKDSTPLQESSREDDDRKSAKSGRSRKFLVSPLHRSSPSPVMSKVERSIKAALLIQRWYRRYCARLEIRRRYTWSIFQSIEYAGEQDQMKLYNFFNTLLTHMGDNSNAGQDIVDALSSKHPTPKGELSGATIEEILEGVLDLENITVESNYKGPHLVLPFTIATVHELIESFKKKKSLHARYVYLLAREAVKVLRQRPTVVSVSSAIAGQITICGDLHGKLDDLFMIFYKNGLPSTDNPYVFNGDFVDRGKKSLEVFLVLMALLVVFPSEVFLNRGNHEDLVMNLRYGFCREVNRKYKGVHGPKILALLEQVYRWLPLATVIDGKVFVVHGGVSSETDLKFLAEIDRGKYTSILRRPHGESTEDDDDEDFSEDGMSEDDTEDEDKKGAQLKGLSDNYEWRQVIDLLWSDPQSGEGCRPNVFRGGGAYFGPDVTMNFLRRHGLCLLIRSHECKPEGYEFAHNKKCLTIFSASNYYETGSNRGAYVTLQGKDHHPHFVQYSSDTKKPMTIRERVGRMESSALRELRGQILANRSKLLEAFQQIDNENSGQVTTTQWVDVMEKCSRLNVPWRVLRDKLVTCVDGKVDYTSTFSDDKLGPQKDLQTGSSTVLETLYRHKSSLETIFRLIDKDNSGRQFDYLNSSFNEGSFIGFISMDEFRESCELISSYVDMPLSKSDIGDLARSMDINKDGFIDFNEFLECFRIVDYEQRKELEDDF